MKCLKCRQTIKKEDVYGLHTACYKNWFDLPDTLEFSRLNPKKQDSAKSLPDIKKTTDTFYHGQYLKYSAQLGDVKYILKVQQTDFPDMPMMEYTCNQIASLLKINVPDYYLIKFKGELHEKEIKNTKKGVMTFITKNFMQNITGTLDHIYKFLPKRHENYNCKNLINVISETTSALTETKKFIEICLFDALIGNNDRHGRNLGIINTGKSRKLAPMYDNPSYIGGVAEPLLGAHFSIGGCIQTSDSKEPKAKDYLKEFKKLGFENICTLFVKNLKDIFPAIIEEVKISEISEKRKKSFIQFLDHRFEDFQND